MPGRSATTHGRRSPAIPQLNERARGWLRYVHQKATTADDWSSSGLPAEWWDDTSTEPVLNFARFDLSESSYAIALMADTTPAWREVYGGVLDGLVARHVTYWAAIDWLTYLGPDPRRQEYPEEWASLWLPPDRVGSYDMPGWTANGVEPWGLQPDPVGADGNLFFKGWLNLMMGFHEYVTGSQKWNEEFLVTGLHDAQYSWTHDAVNDLLVRQWRDRKDGPHCENTKVWPYCLSAAGLGLRLHDILRGGRSHDVFDAWTSILRSKFIGRDGDGPISWMALYYDPIIDYIHRAGPTSGLWVSIYLLPQDRHLAEVLYRTAVDRIGWSDPGRPVRTLPDPRFLCLGLVLAHEFGDAITQARLSAYAEGHFQPAFFGEDNASFGWWFGFGEPYPRGQLTALMAMVDATTTGGWWRLFNTPNLTKFTEPTVVGVDFPVLGISTAWNDTTDQVLHVSTYAATPSQRGTPTTFTIENIPDSTQLRIRCDGQDFNAWVAVGPRTIEVRTDVDTHDFELHWRTTTPAHGHTRDSRTLNVDRVSTPGPTNQIAIRGLSPLTVVQSTTCPCCRESG